MAAKTFKITITLDEQDASYFQGLYRVAKRNARAEDAPKTIALKMAECEPHVGLLTFHTDPAKGKVWVEFPKADGPRGVIGRYLYVESLLQGLGSNPVGLDRGQLGPSRVVAIPLAMAPAM